jgi:hypothetical protein
VVRDCGWWVEIMALVVRCRPNRGFGRKFNNLKCQLPALAWRTRQAAGEFENNKIQEPFLQLWAFGNIEDLRALELCVLINLFLTE